jgi:hypothetical protein
MPKKIPVLTGTGVIGSIKSGSGELHHRIFVKALSPQWGLPVNKREMHMMLSL